MDIIDTLRQRFKYAGIVEKLIYVNLTVFFIVFILNTFGFLFQTKSNFFVEWFSLPANFSEFLYKPWSIVTYGFIHSGFIHILFNLIALFFIGNLFNQYFTSKQLLNFYIFGTALGGFIFMISYNFFPALRSNADRSILIGASAGISAIFIGIATYMPNYEIRLPLVGFIKLWTLATIWVALDVIQIPAGNAGGRLAHIGGALFGFIYVKYASNKEIVIINPFSEIFKKKEKKSNLKTVYKSGKKDATSTSALKKTEIQKKTDLILDKISKSGYETLSKEEKDFLFKQGRK